MRRMWPDEAVRRALLIAALKRKNWDNAQIKQALATAAPEGGAAQG